MKPAGQISRQYILFLIFVFLIRIPDIAHCQDKDYRIGANDVLHLIIYAGGDKQHESDLTVSPQGMINAPFIGIIKAKDLTVGQLQIEISKLLAKDYFVNPELDIYVKEYHSLQYYISGAVKQPGLYKTTSEATLLELIAKAGGTLPERGKVAYIMRSSSEEALSETEKMEASISKEPIKVNLQLLLDKGDLSVNVQLKPGDVVYIPAQISFALAESKIYVEGEVVKPGIFDYQIGMTAMNACIIAGGFTKFAAPNRAKIIRQQAEGVEIIKINLIRVQEGKIKDTELQPGDRIHIPETWI
ncbi:MAG: SLBB domain-containing protein [Thermodesulfobacteriota bacterium]